MHVPDGVLSPAVCAVTGAAAAGAVGLSLYKLRDSLADRTIPLTGMMASLIFAGQMVNFPLFGTVVSGHLIGGVLAAAVLGPWAGLLAIALVLAVQCLLFADGGLLALGANVLNMGVAGAWGGYVVLATVRRLLGDGLRSAVAASVAAAWLSVMAAAALFCLEFRLSWASDYDFSRILTLMVTFHSAIGIGEALITGAVVSFVAVQRPDLIHVAAEGRRPIANAGRAVLAIGVVSLAVAAFLAPFASQYADGLDSVAQWTGFDKLSATRPLVFEDYNTLVPGWEKLSTSLAGILGVAAVLAIAFVMSRAAALRPPAAGTGHVE
ncbi:MAG TPA: energy-coupling factor ABC transporter permease [Planctomycetaceae bacterium]|nr:energy-coupling factor ABC transporter permease [Planctomycetaceae bacterium]